MIEIVFYYSSCLVEIYRDKTWIELNLIFEHDNFLGEEMNGNL